MSDLGKRIRLSRLIEPETNSCVVCALDHGMTSPTFLSGLFDTRLRTKEAVAGGANVFMLSQGIARLVQPEFRPETSLALMLSASAAGRPAGAVITPIGSVEAALRLGADAVVVYVALAGDNEDEMISYVSSVGEACQELGMPFIAEAEYPNAYQSLTDLSSAFGADYLMRNARLCVELGADIVKVNWSGDAISFGEIVRATQMPVIVAGGTLISEMELLGRIEQAMDVGAIGCSVGRNIFQHEHPEAMTRALSRVIKERVPAKQAWEELQEAVAAQKENR